MEENSKQLLASKSYGKILSDGFKLFSRTYVKIILPIMLLQIISILVQVFLLTDLIWIAFTTEDLLILLGILTLQSIITIFFNVICWSLVSSYVYKTYVYGKESVNLAEEIKKAFNPKLILVILILGLFMPIGLSMFFLFIPGIIIFGFYIFFIFTYNLDDTKENPIKKAKSIAKGSFRKIIFVYLIFWIIRLIFDGIYSIILSFIWDPSVATIDSWYNPATRNYGMIFLYVLIYSIVSLLFAPLFICLLTPLFASRKARHDLGPQYQHKKRYPKQEPYYQPAPSREPYPAQTPQATPWKSRVQQAQLDSGLFCPFCGEKIDVPKRFCPSCGESLEELK